MRWSPERPRISIRAMVVRRIFGHRIRGIAVNRSVHGPAPWATERARNFSGRAWPCLRFSHRLLYLRLTVRGLFMTTARRILIVDDDTELREALLEQLSLHDEFDPVSADTGPKGGQAAKGGQIDLVIMDVGLPDIDG